MTPNDFLKAFPAFRSSSDSLVREILSSGQVKPFPAGKNIYSEGDACSAIAFVLSGEVRVYKTGETGREITLYEIGPGETCILNASCLLSGTSYPAYAVTTAEGSMLLVPAPDFRRMVAEHEALRDFVFGLLSRRLAGVMELVEEVAFGRMDQRLMDYLVEKADLDAGWVFPVPDETYVHGHDAMMGHVVDAFRRGARPRETFHDGYIVNAVLDAAYRSIRSGRWEPVVTDESLLAAA